MNKNYKFIDSFRYTEAMTLRRIYCEGNFEIMKENHNLRKKVAYYISTREGWLYLATVKDLCTKEIVG